MTIRLVSIHLHILPWATKREGGTAMLPTKLFVTMSYEGAWSLKNSDNSWTLQEKNSEIPICCSHWDTSSKHSYFDLPPPILGSVTQHTHEKLKKKFMNNTIGFEKNTWRCSIGAMSDFSCHVVTHIWELWHIRPKHGLMLVFGSKSVSSHRVSFQIHR